MWLGSTGAFSNMHRAVFHCGVDLTLADQIECWSLYNCTLSVTTSLYVIRDCCTIYVARYLCTTHVTTAADVGRRLLPCLRHFPRSRPRPAVLSLSLSSSPRALELTRNDTMPAQCRGRELTRHMSQKAILLEVDQCEWTSDWNQDGFPHWTEGA